MGRKKATSQIFASSHSFTGAPAQALKRDIVKEQQTRFDEDTIVWGNDDALPLRILQAISDSPTTTSCLGKVSDFIQGAGFTDKALMELPIDKDGTTLWEFHQQLCDYFAKLEGFSVRFTYDMEGLITNAFVMGMESVRFVKPSRTTSSRITQLKYNPYWGTELFNNADTKCFNAFEPSQEKRYAEISEADPQSYKGQIFFYGNPLAPYKFYPVPKFWSGSNWIYIDAQVQSFIKKLLDNGFFQSTLIKMIGDPTQPSKNPKYQKKVTGTDGTVRTQSDGTTVGQEFEEMMNQTFSGHDKAGKAMVLWALNKDNTPSIESFPINTNFDNISGTIENAIRGITIATEVPAILANLPQQISSLGSDGDSMRMAVELMQARTKQPQIALEQFYNNILLPNLQETTTARVKIINHTPLSNQIQVPDKVWEWMNDQEKADFVKANMPQVKVIRDLTATPAIQPLQDPNAPQPDQVQAKVNEALKGLKISDINRLKNIANKVENGALTFEQGKQILMGYGFDEEQIKAWLSAPTEGVVI